jgi:branched-chain amino acid transport system permease protein
LSKTVEQEDGAPAPAASLGRTGGVLGVLRDRAKAFDLAGIVLPVLVFSFALHIYNNELLLVYMMVYVVLAQAINVSYGFTGYLPFGLFGIFGVGAYAGALATLNLHVPALVGVLFGGLGGVVIGLIFMPLFRLRGAYFAVATLAGAEAVADIVSNPSLVKVTNGPYGINLAAYYSSGQFYVSAVVLVGLTLAVVYYLRHSRFGLSLQAIRDDAYSAAMAGVNVVRYRSTAWLIAAALAGMAGAVFGWATSVFYPTAVFDSSISVFAIVFALFGGTGSLWGPTIGAVVLYALYSAIGISNPQFFELIYGLVIILLILFVPRGLAGLGRSLIERLRGAS